MNNLAAHENALLAQRVAAAEAKAAAAGPLKGRVRGEAGRCGGEQALLTAAEGQGAAHLLTAAGVKRRCSQPRPPDTLDTNTHACVL